MRFCRGVAFVITVARVDLCLMSSLTRLLSLQVVALVAGMALAAAPPAEELKSLYSPHPRLFVHSEDVVRLRELVRNDPLMIAWHENLLAAGERMLKQEPIQHKLIGPRLLDKSRTALNRISTLAGLYLIDGDRRFAERAKQEMFTAVGFADWNPSHFLDTAEMSNAIGIGYDWLYGFLSAEERKTIREGLIKLGLQAGLSGFEKRTSWTRATHNWSQVCNGGLTVGALAIADEEPEIAGRLIGLCRRAIKPSMNAFAPDGGFAEGPGYWGYATIYNVYYLAALESALKTDFGLNAMPGFAETGFYRIQSVSPIGKTFNYADAGDGAGSAPQMLYLSRVFRQPDFAGHELSRTPRNGSIFHMIWYSQLPVEYRKPRIENDPPLAAFFRGVNVAFFRSAWNDPNALFVGIKAGDNKANHSHLDLGSFVLDSQGKRFAVDLGGDDYNLPNYFGNKRWTYYRLRTESHNTLVLDGENQDPKAVAKIVAFSTGKERSHAVIDLSAAYKAKATKVMRGLAMLGGKRVLVQDEVVADDPVDVVWGFLTPAEINIQGGTATLTQGSAVLSMKILLPADARFEVISANPPAPQRQQPDIHNLTVRLREKTTSARIAVLIAVGKDAGEAVNIEPLDQWSGR